MAAAAMELPAEQTTPPALTEARKEEIRQALAEFSDFQAKNARDALNVLSELDNMDGKSFADYQLGEARRSASKAGNSAGETIDGHEALAQGRATWTENLDAYTPKKEGTRDWGSHPYDKVADPLKVNPIEETLRNLEEPIRKNAEQVTQLKAQKEEDLKRHGNTYYNGRLELAEKAAERFGQITQELETANVRFKGALGPLSRALQEKGITPDEIVRYNDELKEKIIADTLADFTRKGDSGEKSKAETAREALAVFSERDRHSSLASVTNGITDLAGMGEGKAGNGEFSDYSVGSASLARAAENMDRIIAQAKPDAYQKLADARALFVEATRDMKEAFGKNAIGAEALQRYNSKVAQAELKRGAEFEGQDTRTKVEQFVKENDGANLKRYDAVVEGINALLGVKDKPDYQAGGDKGAGAYLAKNEAFLTAVRDHYANKREAVQAVADGRALTQDEYQSIIQHPVVNAQFDDKSFIPQYSLEYKDEPRRVGHDTLTQTAIVVSEITSRVKSHDPDILAAQGTINKMRDAVFKGEKLHEVEKKYGVTPENFRKLMESGALEVVRQPAEEKPAAQANAAATGESPILLADPSPRITGPKEGELEALTGGFVARASSANKRELLRARQELTPLERRIDERLAAEGQQNER